MSVVLSESKSALALQNRFRGLVSAYKSRRFVKDKTDDQALRFREGVREIYLDARVKLTKEFFSEFIEWVDHQSETQLPDLKLIPRAYDHLTGVITKSFVGLEKELHWLVARLNSRSIELKSFRSAVPNLEKLILENKFDEAISIVETLNTEFGVTMWSVQLRIFLEQMNGGLESQKKYTAEVRSVYQRGLLSYVAYWTSVRNEDRTTYVKFQDDAAARIDNHTLHSDAVKSYMRYRLIGTWPANEDGVADILRIEQSHSIIDIYETFIAASQWLLKNDSLEHGRDALKTAMSQLSFQSDFRLQKIAVLLGLPDFQQDLSQRDCLT